MGLRAFAILEFLDKRLDWQFDRREASVSADVSWVRWRRGPVTLYRQHVKVPSVANGSVDWVLMFWDDLGVGLHLPHGMTRALDKVMGVA